MIKQSLFCLARSSVFSSFVSLLERIDLREADLLRVLTYHRIDEIDRQPNLDPATLSTTPADFALQMQHLSEHYRVVDFDTVLQAVRGKQPLPRRSVLITFDDANQDFADNAWPVLRQFQLPAILFVPTAFPDAPERTFWWDRLYAAICRSDCGPEELAELGVVHPSRNRYEAYRQALRWVKTQPFEQSLEVIDRICARCDSPKPENSVLSWDDLRRLAAEGLTLGAHTRTHPLMNRLPVEQAVREAVGSYEDLQSRVGATPRVFAFPGGVFSEPIVERLRDIFDLAFTTCRGLNDLRSADRMRLRRINVGRYTPRALIRAQLLSQFRHLNCCWRMRSD